MFTFQWHSENFPHYFLVSLLFLSRKILRCNKIVKSRPSNTHHTNEIDCVESEPNKCVAWSVTVSFSGPKGTRKEKNDRKVSISLKWNYPFVHFGCLIQTDSHNCFVLCVFLIFLTRYKRKSSAGSVYSTHTFHISTATLIPGFQ